MKEGPQKTLEAVWQHRVAGITNQVLYRMRFPAAPTPPRDTAGRSYWIESVQGYWQWWTNGKALLPPSSSWLKGKPKDTASTCTLKVNVAAEVLCRIKICQSSLGKGQDWVGVLEASGARGSLGWETQEREKHPPLFLWYPQHRCASLSVCGTGGWRAHGQHFQPLYGKPQWLAAAPGSQHWSGGSSVVVPVLHADSRKEFEAWQCQGKKLSCLADHSAASCSSQRMVFLNGRRNSGCSLGLAYQRVAQFSLGVLEGMGSWIRSLPFPRLCSFWIKDLSSFPPNLCFQSWPMGDASSWTPLSVK